jgi:hypothetical protein
METKFIMMSFAISPIKGKTVPVTGRQGPSGCERSRLPHLLDSRLIDGDRVVSLARWPTVFLFWPYSAIQVFSACMKIFVSLQLLDLGQSVGLL